MERYIPWPYTWNPDVEQWTIPDHLLLAIWDEMVATGRAEEVFIDGCVSTGAGWLDFLRRPGTHPVVAVDSIAERPVGIAWLTHLRLGHNAEGHFCGCGPYRRGAYTAVLDYWRSWKLFQVVIGFTPANNEKAVRAVKIAGFRECGRIPKFYKHPDGPVAAVVLALEV